MKRVILNGPAPKSVGDVLRERKRQIDAEGYTLAHDAEHDPGELAAAGAAYALNASCVLYPLNGTPLEGTPEIWMWEPEAWKPKTPREDLVRAAALIIAEIDRIDCEEDGGKLAYPTAEILAGQWRAGPLVDQWILDGCDWHFWISYNLHPCSDDPERRSDDGLPETALCIQTDAKLFGLTLNGDFRAEFEGPARRSLAECLKVWESLKGEHASSQSDKWEGMAP